MSIQDPEVRKLTKSLPAGNSGGSKEHSLVRQVLDASKRILAHKTIKKEPITAEILQKLHDKFVPLTLI